MIVKAKYENIEDFLICLDDDVRDTYSILCTYDDAVKVLRYYLADEEYTIAVCYLTDDPVDYDGEYLIGFTYDKKVFCEKANVGKDKPKYLMTEGIVNILPGCSEEAVSQYNRSADYTVAVSFMDDEEIEKSDDKTCVRNSENIIEITDGEGKLQAVMKNIDSDNDGIKTHWSIYFSSNDEEQVKYAISLLKEK